MPCRCEDSLAPWRGIVNAFILSVVLWWPVINALL